MFNGAALAGCAVFSYPFRDYVLVGGMLLLPFLDRDWKPPGIALTARRSVFWLAPILAMVLILFWRPDALAFAVSTLLLAALPEEWFFRAYFMTRAGNGWRANLIASLLFALMHSLARDWITGVLVFIPSLFYGWLYQRTRDLPLLVMVHALSNLIYGTFLAQFLAVFLRNLR